MKLTIDGRSYDVEVQPDAVIVGGVSLKTTVLQDNGDATVRVGGRPYKVRVKDEKTVVVDGRTFSVEVSGQATSARAAGAKPCAKPATGPSETGAVRALMPGTVLALRVKEGEHVVAGAVLLILEAMKMQNEIKAPHEGTVRRLPVAAGQTVANGDVLAVIE